MGFREFAFRYRFMQRQRERYIPFLRENDCIYFFDEYGRLHIENEINNKRYTECITIGFEDIRPMNYLNRHMFDWKHYMIKGLRRTRWEIEKLKQRNKTYKRRTMEDLWQIQEVVLASSIQSQPYKE